LVLEELHGGKKSRPAPHAKVAARGGPWAGGAIDPGAVA